MKKITFKSLLTLLGFLFVFSANAQQTRKSQTPKVPFQLTADSQRSLDETGFVRCASIEMDQQRKQRESHIQSDQEFEDWLAPLIQARKAEIAQQRANGTFRMAVVNIPIIFHVISSGGASNLSQAQVQAQIDQLNIDFANLAGSTDPVAADAQIVFLPAQVDPLGNPLAEPGINRVTAYGSGPFPTTDFDVGGGGLDIKSTGWDYSLYANVWSADITGGILGYAQFPSNSTLPGMAANGGTAINSGVVVGYGTVGSVAMPGSAAPYNLGRTLTHEVGHWMGLRHIWGDGNCTADDFCADTPNSDASNFGCANPDSCGSPDMVENYMDYTDDSCMDIFTADQVLRIDTVLINADGLSDLSTSTTATVGPVIAFSNAAQTIVEGTDCNYTDISIPVNIGANPSAIANVTVSVTGGTATANDYLLMNTSLTFPTGASVSQNTTLRIYNDSFVEGDKTIVLGLGSLNANSGDATLTTAPTIGNTITITSDDVASSATTVLTVFEEDFDPTIVNSFTIADQDGDGNNWGISNEAAFGLATPVGFQGDFLLSLSWNGAALTPNNYITTADPIVLPVGLTNLELAFDSGTIEADPFQNEQYSVYLTTSNDPAVIEATTALFNETLTLASGWTTQTINIDALAGQPVYLTFRHHDTVDENTLIVDNISITGTNTTGIQTVVNAAQNDLLSSTGLIYTTDATSGDVMADVNNNNGVDYGCIATNVSRASGGAQIYQVAGAPNFVMDKTFTITPALVQAGGNATVKFYFTEAEIAAWEVATGNLRGELMIIKDNGATQMPVVPTIGAFGSAGVTLEGVYTTGINGIYYFGKAESLGVANNDFALFNAYPNPTNGNVNITLSSNEDVQVSLFDIRGRQVYSKIHNNNSATFNEVIDLSAVSAGVYLLNVESGDKRATKKLVIQ